MIGTIFLGGTARSKSSGGAGLPGAWGPGLEVPPQFFGVWHGAKRLRV